MHRKPTRKSRSDTQLELAFGVEPPAERVLEPRQRDHVAHRPAGDDVVDRRAVQAAVAGDLRDGPSRLSERFGERTGDGGELGDADRGALDGGPSGEDPFDVIAGASGVTSGTGHAYPGYYAGPSASRSANTRSIRQTEGCNPHNDEAKRDDHMNALAGRRIHEMLHTVAGRGAGPSDALAAARQQAAGLGETGTVAAGVRTRVANGLAAYLRCFDVEGWVLLGWEVPLGGGFADLVWKTPFGVVIDEVKSGALDPFDRRLLNQVDRYVTAGLGRWGDDFAGVRVLPLTTPRKAMFVNEKGDWRPMGVLYPGRAT